MWLSVYLCEFCFSFLLWKVKMLHAFFRLSPQNLPKSPNRLRSFCRPFEPAPEKRVTSKRGEPHPGRPNNWRPAGRTRRSRPPRCRWRRERPEPENLPENPRPPRSRDPWSFSATCHPWLGLLLSFLCCLLAWFCLASHGFALPCLALPSQESPRREPWVNDSQLREDPEAA